MSHEEEAKSEYSQSLGTRHALECQCRKRNKDGQEVTGAEGGQNRISFEVLNTINGGSPQRKSEASRDIVLRLQAWRLEGTTLRND